MITDRIGLHSVLLPLLISVNRLYHRNALEAESKPKRHIFIGENLKIIHDQSSEIKLPKWGLIVSYATQGCDVKLKKSSRLLQNLTDLVLKKSLKAQYKLFLDLLKIFIVVSS